MGANRTYPNCIPKSIPEHLFAVYPKTAYALRARSAELLRAYRYGRGSTLVSREMVSGGAKMSVPPPANLHAAKSNTGLLSERLNHLMWSKVDHTCERPVRLIPCKERLSGAIASERDS